MSVCAICLERPRGRGLMCSVCGRAYDRARRSWAGTTWDAIEWAAKRARTYERKRVARARPGATNRLNVPRLTRADIRRALRKGNLEAMASKFYRQHGRDMPDLAERRKALESEA